MRLMKQIYKTDSPKAKFCKYLLDFYFAAEEGGIHYYMVVVYR